jgi:hypothetical protein
MIMLILMSTLAILTLSTQTGYAPLPVKMDVRAPSDGWVCLRVQGPDEQESCWEHTPLSRPVETRRFTLGEGEWEVTVWLGEKKVAGPVKITVLEGDPQ